VGGAQQSAPAPELKPKQPTAKAPDISIHDAVDTGNIKAVKQHIAAGTDMNAKDQWRWTPLHWAAGIGFDEIAELLITNGADVNAKTGSGETPLDQAINKPETIDLLRKHGSKAGAELKAEGK